MKVHFRFYQSTEELDIQDLLVSRNPDQNYFEQAYTTVKSQLPPFCVF